MNVQKIVYQNLVKLLISATPFFFISITTPLGGLTLDRFFVLLISVLMFIISFSRKFKINTIGLTLLFLIIYLTFNRMFTGYELVSKYLLLVTAILIFYISYKSSLNGFEITSAINFSFYIYCLISFYSLIHFFNNGYVPSRFTFLEAIPFIRPIDYEHMETINLSYVFPRLSLPFPTAPQLSIVMAVYSFHFLLKGVTQQTFIDKLRFFIGCVIMLATISRSGIIPLIFFSSIFYLIWSRSNLLIKYAQIIIISFMILGIIILISPDLFEILYSRFFSSNLTSLTSEHLGARKIGFNIFMESPLFNKIFGHGIGNYPGLHSHMSLLTLLVEIGLLGSFLFVFVFIQRFIFTLKIYFKYKIKAIAHLNELMMYGLVFLGMLFYEFTYVLPLYIFLGFYTGQSFREKKLIFNKS